MGIEQILPLSRICSTPLNCQGRAQLCQSCGWMARVHEAALVFRLVFVVLLALSPLAVSSATGAPPCFAAAVAKTGPAAMSFSVEEVASARPGLDAPAELEPMFVGVVRGHLRRNVGSVFED